MATVDQAVAQLILDYGPDITYVRDGGGTGVVRRLRGNFDMFGPFSAGTFDSTAVINDAHGIEHFWTQRRDLFDPSVSPASASISSFTLSTVSTRLAVIQAKQFETVNGKQVEIEGATITARIAARPPDGSGKIPWQLDGFDNTLVPAVKPQQGILSVTPDEIGRTASQAIFARTDIAFIVPARNPIMRAFPASNGAQPCWQILFPAQPNLHGRTWGRGAVVYWPADPVMPPRPFHIEPDGRYVSMLMDGNTGPYHRQPTSLWVTPTGPNRYELVDDSLKQQGGPEIRSGHLDRSASPPCVTPLVADNQGWQDRPDLGANRNPGVGTDVHAYARTTAEYFLALRDRAGLSNEVLPDPLELAVHVTPAAQPGEWRKSSNTVVIANSDANLPRSWMKRWDYCCAEDVVAHEIAHGMLNMRCTFEYSLESGALEEALADLFAVLSTRNPAIFAKPWMREATASVPTADWLRHADWTGALRAAPLTPNDRVERGEYPNHYSQLARLGRSNAEASRRSKPKNDHGYLHWNCAIMTRALAMLAQPAGTMLTNPETGLQAIAIGPGAAGDPNPVADLVFAAVQMTLDGQFIANIDNAETPFARFRAALLDIATSSQFDDAEGRLHAVQLVNVLNAAGIGPILSVRGRPAGVPPHMMPTPIGPLGWTVKIEQPNGNTATWTPGSTDPIRISRQRDAQISAKAVNLGISADAALPTLSALVEKTRSASGTPEDFASLEPSATPEPASPISSGQIANLTPRVIRSADLRGCVSDPWLVVITSDPWNAIRSRATARAAITALATRQDFVVPLNMALIRLQLVD